MSCGSASGPSAVCSIMAVSGAGGRTLEVRGGLTSGQPEGAQLHPGKRVGQEVVRDDESTITTMICCFEGGLVAFVMAQFCRQHMGRFQGVLGRHVG